MTLIVLLSTLGILVYSAFLLNPSHRGDVIPYVLILIAESVLVFHALLSMWTILAGASDPRDFDYYRTHSKLFARGSKGPQSQWPFLIKGSECTVDVFITTYGENVDVIRKTVTAAVAMRGRHVTWVLDDGKSDEVRDLAAELGARYVRRLSSGGAKAGNINHALTLAKGQFFAIFDADFVPDDSFLVETVPFFIDTQVAFVQTPQTFGNLHTTVARGAGYMQAVFYRFIQPGRNRFNAAFCVGTNVLFRRAAIDDVGGIYTDSKSEDVWTSIKLHERGWRSVYIPDVLAVGEAPESIEAYSKQQLRWATGGFEIMLTHNPLSRKRNLTTDQRIQYFVTGSFYLTGITPLILLLVPSLEIYFDLRPVTVSVSVLTWFLYYAGFYVMQIVLAWYTLGSFRWETLTLAAVSFPIYVKALFNVLTGRDVGWQATGTARSNSPYNFVVPQMLFFLFLALTSVLAVIRDVTNGHATLAMAWNVTNTVILGAFLVSVTRDARMLRRGDDARLNTGPQSKRAPVRTVIVRPEHPTMEAASAPFPAPAPPAPAPRTGHVAAPVPDPLHEPAMAAAPAPSPAVAVATDPDPAPVALPKRAASTPLPVRRTSR